LRAHDGNIRTHVLAHAHPDHQGTSAAVCGWFDAELRCHEADSEVVESGETAAPMPSNRSNRVLERLSAGPGHPVAETISEGDSVGGFEIIETPGNAPGYVSLWRERDGTVILGDVLANVNLLTGRYGLQTLPDRFASAPDRSVESVREIADLEPDTVCFGHGPPLHDGTEFEEFVASLS
jgi:glyoxylase-like metal-dependent hydrolase (beta-lactamase superfamily II)